MPTQIILPQTCYTHLERLVQSADVHDLFIFDIDEVLLQAKDQVLRPPHKNKWLWDFIESKMDEAESIHFMGHIWSDYEVDLVDPILPKLTQTLAHKGISSMALTAGWNGRLGKNEMHCEARIQSLKEFDIDFSHTFNFSDEVILHDHRLSGRTASFKKGVGFACMLPKHEVLHSLLQHVKTRPHHIYFVDDVMENLEGMASYCAQQNISFTGYHYTGVEHREHNIPLNTPRAHLQYETVLTTGIWISDREADTRLTNTKMEMENAQKMHSS